MRDRARKEEIKLMTANTMIFNAIVLSIALTLVGVAWGFLILKLQGGEEEPL